ncbi:MAG TPA: hypothetical protein VJV04_16635 [Nitrospiraceae bacterium]|nr:hypothetical protein [Nitrospiraceae bacterium]
MEQRETQRDRREDQKDEESDSQLEREEEYQAIIQPDPLLAEVGKANEKISNPSEAQRVIPSKPC